MPSCSPLPLHRWQLNGGVCAHTALVIPPSTLWVKVLPLDKRAGGADPPSTYVCRSTYQSCRRKTIRSILIQTFFDFRSTPIALCVPTPAVVHNWNSGCFNKFITNKVTMNTQQNFVINWPNSIFPHLRLILTQPSGNFCHRAIPALTHQYNRESDRQLLFHRTVCQSLPRSANWCPGTKSFKINFISSL